MNPISRSLSAVALEMRKAADACLFDPEPKTLTEAMKAVEELKKFSRELDVDGVHVIILFTRTTIEDKQYYHLSISNTTFTIDEIPAETVEKLKTAFVPAGEPHTGVLRNCIQFLEPIAN